MSALWTWLDGKKSYLGAALIGLAAVLQLFPSVPPELTAWIQKEGLALFGVGIAHKIEKAIVALKNGS